MLRAWAWPESESLGNQSSPPRYSPVVKAQSRRKVSWMRAASGPSKRKCVSRMGKALMFMPPVKAIFPSTVRIFRWLRMLR